MRIYRIVISFVAATLVVLMMLLAGLKIFNDRQSEAVALPPGFEVEYLSPEEAALLLNQDRDGDREADKD